MKIYTIVETEESFSSPLSVKAIGSELFLPFARNALANRIVKRAQEDLSFAYAMWNDVNHGEEFRTFMRDNACREDVEDLFDRDEDEKRFPEEVERALYRFILENVVGDESYHVFVADATEHMIHLDIEGNELREGMPK